MPSMPAALFLRNLFRALAVSAVLTESCKCSKVLPRLCCVSAPMMGAAAMLAGAAGASRLLNAWYHALVEMPVGASSRFRYLRQDLPGS